MDISLSARILFACVVVLAVVVEGGETPRDDIWRLLNDSAKPVNHTELASLLSEKVGPRPASTSTETNAARQWKTSEEIFEVAGPGIVRLDWAALFADPVADTEALVALADHLVTTKMFLQDPLYVATVLLQLEWRMVTIRALIMPASPSKTLSLTSTLPPSYTSSSSTATSSSSTTTSSSSSATSSSSSATSPSSTSPSSSSSTSAPLLSQPAAPSEVERRRKDAALSFVRVFECRRNIWNAANALEMTVVKSAFGEYPLQPAGPFLGAYESELTPMDGKNWSDATPIALPEFLSLLNIISSTSANAQGLIGDFPLSLASLVFAARDMLHWQPRAAELLALDYLMVTQFREPMPASRAILFAFLAHQKFADKPYHKFIGDTFIRSFDHIDLYMPYVQSVLEAAVPDSSRDAFSASLLGFKLDTSYDASAMRMLKQAMGVLVTTRSALNFCRAVSKVTKMDISSRFEQLTFQPALLQLTKSMVSLAIDDEALMDSPQFSWAYKTATHERRLRNSFFLLALSNPYFTEIFESFLAVMPDTGNPIPSEALLVRSQCLAEYIDPIPSRSTKPGGLSSISRPADRPASRQIPLAYWFDLGPNYFVSNMIKFAMDDFSMLVGDAVKGFLPKLSERWDNQGARKVSLNALFGSQTLEAEALVLNASSKALELHVELWSQHCIIMSRVLSSQLHRLARVCPIPTSIDYRNVRSYNLESQLRHLLTAVAQPEAIMPDSVLKVDEFFQLLVDEHQAHAMDPLLETDNLNDYLSQSPVRIQIFKKAMALWLDYLRMLGVPHQNLLPTVDATEVDFDDVKKKILASNRSDDYMCILRVLLDDLTTINDTARPLDYEQWLATSKAYSEAERHETPLQSTLNPQGLGVVSLAYALPRWLKVNPTCGPSIIRNWSLARQHLSMATYQNMDPKEFKDLPAELKAQTIFMFILASLSARHPLAPMLLNRSPPKLPFPMHCLGFLLFDMPYYENPYFAGGEFSIVKVWLYVSLNAFIGLSDSVERYALLKLLRPNDSTLNEWNQLPLMADSAAYLSIEQWFLVERLKSRDQPLPMTTEEVAALSAQRISPDLINALNMGSFFSKVPNVSADTASSSGANVARSIKTNATSLSTTNTSSASTRHRPSPAPPLPPALQARMKTETATWEAVAKESSKSVKGNSNALTEKEAMKSFLSMFKGREIPLPNGDTAFIVDEVNAEPTSSKKPIVPPLPPVTETAEGKKGQDTKPKSAAGVSSPKPSTSKPDSTAPSKKGNKKRDKKRRKLAAKLARRENGDAEDDDDVKGETEKSDEELQPAPAKKRKDEVCRACVMFKGGLAYKVTSERIVFNNSWGYNRGHKQVRPEDICYLLECLQTGQGIDFALSGTLVRLIIDQQTSGWKLPLPAADPIDWTSAWQPRSRSLQASSLSSVFEKLTAEERDRLASLMLYSSSHAFEMSLFEGTVNVALKVKASTDNVWMIEDGFLFYPQHLEDAVKRLNREDVGSLKHSLSDFLRLQDPASAATLYASELESKRRHAHQQQVAKERAEADKLLVATHANHFVPIDTTPTFPIKSAVREAFGNEGFSTFAMRKISPLSTPNASESVLQRLSANELSSPMPVAQFLKERVVPIRAGQFAHMQELKEDFSRTLASASSLTYASSSSSTSSTLSPSTSLVSSGWVALDFEFTGIRLPLKILDPLQRALHCALKHSVFEAGLFLPMPHALLTTSLSSASPSSTLSSASSTSSLSALPSSLTAAAYSMLTCPLDNGGAMHFHSLPFIEQNHPGFTVQSYNAQAVSEQVYLKPMLAELSSTKTLVVLHNGLTDLMHSCKIVLGSTELLLRSQSETPLEIARSLFRFIDTRSIFLRGPQHWIDLYNSSKPAGDKRLRLQDFYLDTGVIDSRLGVLCQLLLDIDVASLKLHNAGADAVLTGLLYHWFLQNDSLLVGKCEGHFTT